MQHDMPSTAAGNAGGEPHPPGLAPLSPAIAATAPGALRVIKRNGAVVSYDDDKIQVALAKAFLAVEGGTAAASSRIRELVAGLTEQVTGTFRRRLPSGGTIHIEEIQDQVELALMRSGEHKVARDYVLYREERARIRAANAATAQPDGPAIRMAAEDGSLLPLDAARIRGMAAEACDGLDGVDAQRIVEVAQAEMYDGIKAQDIAASLMMTARAMVEEEPNYTYAAARLLLGRFRAEALEFLGLSADATQGATQKDMAKLYPVALAAFIERGVELELLAPELKRFDIERLGRAIKPKRDKMFTYLGLQTLYDRYFIHSGNVRFELPQVFFMRVAMGLAVQEDEPEERAIEFYDLLSSFDYMSSTPTLFNSGTLRSQLSSCFLTTVSDDLDGIYSAIRDNALLSKWAGGLGNDWTPVRALGAYIKGTNGKSQGVVPFLKVVNDTAVAVNQGGKRKGAVCSYLETWHLDIEEFLELRKNTGDDRRRTHDMNTANWVPDLFMKRVFEDGQWTLFSPNDVPDLHDLYGTAFEQRYCEYERMAESGELALFKRIGAKELWRKMLSMLFETGHPWITFKDACNVRSPQQHVGVVHSSNLCTEITLNTSQGEIAVCNLGSVNLARHVVDGALDRKKLKRTVQTAVRMLDNVIDINYYAVPQARTSNMRHRPVGLGVMGFQDALYKLGVPYGSEAAVEFADRSMEALSYFAIDASFQARQGTRQLRDLRGLPVEPRHPAHRFAEAPCGPARQELPGRRHLDHAGLGQAAAQGADQGHAQLQRDGDCAHRHHRQHRRRVPVHRTDLSEPVREVEPLRRVHRRQPVHGARLEARRRVGQGDGQRPQVLRRQPGADRPRAGGTQAAVRHGLRGGTALAGGRRRSPPEVDRPGAVPESLHRRRVRQEAGRHLPHGLAARLEDHLLPALPRRHQCGEVDAGEGRHAERRRHRQPVAGGNRDARNRQPAPRNASRTARGLHHRRSRLRSMSVGMARGRCCHPRPSRRRGRACGEGQSRRLQSHRRRRC